ncbi:YaaR family protein [Alkalicella caledoniensis]|uniref:YaaR family protein n=1 Tax=Alkalicella caledoniensis TaxID=2731377 RepID=A0A7G9W4U3_ALKCA|nr:YaaR family protein [Alkalicella caledoniensis]QNO13705.1 YaaR family protein [Alkalicella caledoniensis]
MARIVNSKNSMSNTRLIDNVRLNRSGIDQKVSPFELQFKISHLKSELDQLLVDIDEQGKSLSEKMTLKDLKKYHSLIASYIKKATGEMYRLKSENGDYYNPHKIYMTIEKIDEELENITQNLLSTESDNLYVLDKINFIKGLLINIEV